jgi:leucyl/phenylalanyl-tRNA--protein transferase
MADPEDDEIYWYSPDPRAVLPLETFHIPKNLEKLVARGRFEVVSDRDFEGVIRACAGRDSTWISEEVIRVYSALNEKGFAHSVECWLDGRLVGGLYGVAVGAAFFGESMFHHETDASKVALVHLVRRLRQGGYMLLDTQYSTRHLEQFGVTQVSRKEYERLLEEAVAKDATWL